MESVWLDEIQCQKVRNKAVRREHWFLPFVIRVLMLFGKEVQIVLTIFKIVQSLYILFWFLMNLNYITRKQYKKIKTLYYLFGQILGTNAEKAFGGQGASFIITFIFYEYTWFLIIAFCRWKNKKSNHILTTMIVFASL